MFFVKMMKFVRTMILTALVMVMCSSMAFAATTLKIANYFAVDHPANKVLAEVFKPMVEAKTNGSLQVQVFPNNQLGAEQEFVEGVQLGTIEMALTGNLWENTVDLFKLLQLPYMFNSYEHADAVFNGPIGEKIYESLKPLGVKILGAFPRGFRVISNNKKPINSIEDCKGIKIRVWQGEVIIKLMQGFGFSTVVMPMSEVFTALQQGVVHGQDNPLMTSYYAGWYDVQKYVAMTNHIFGFQYFVINQKVWDKLSAEEQAAVNEATKASIAEITKLTKAEEKDVLQKTIDKGLEVTYPDLKPFVESAQPIIDSYVKSCPEAAPFIEQIREVGKQFEK
jgi:tripartite ATP-independent transporter DctP family solute receptor